MLRSFGWWCICWFAVRLLYQLLMEACWNVSHNCRIAFLLSAGLAFASQTLVLCSLACIHSGCGGQALYHSLCLRYFAFIAANFLLVIWPFWELSFGYLLNFAVYLSVQLWVVVALSIIPSIYNLSPLSSLYQFRWSAELSIPVSLTFPGLDYNYLFVWYWC